MRDKSEREWRTKRVYIIEGGEESGGKERIGDDRDQLSGALKTLSACLRIIFKYDVQCGLKCFSLQIILHYISCDESFSSGTCFTDVSLKPCHSRGSPQ